MPVIAELPCIYFVILILFHAKDTDFVVLEPLGGEREHLYSVYFAAERIQQSKKLKI